MHDRGITDLPTKKTWVLVMFSILTYFVYPAHYVKQLSGRLNEEPSVMPKISSALVWAILISSYVSLVLFFGYLAVEETHPVSGLSGFTDTICGILFIVWAFSVRSRMHALLGASRGSPLWFHGFWTFFFNVFYINFKLAKLKKQSA
jgi:hypothetical protein